MHQLGIGTELAKADIKAAYRLVPVHPQDRPLLAMEWQEKVYVDTALPFGLWLAPKLFNALADTLEWYTKEQGVRFLWHYLAILTTTSLSVELVRVNVCLITQFCIMSAVVWGCP